MPPNFQNGKIYSIRSHQTEKIYIGSTTQSLAVRFGGHKKPSNKSTSKDILLFDDAYIELIELFPCDSKMALNLREGEIIRERVCVNKNIAGRTRPEYREDNTETIKENNKQYRQTHTEEAKQYRKDHKESIATIVKQYQQTNKNIRKCSCGVEFNDGHTGDRNRHYRSKHHVKFVEDFYERLHQLLVPEE